MNVAAFRQDPLYPKVARAVNGLLQGGNVVIPVDVLIGMGLLSREHFEDWRRGRVPSLERVIKAASAQVAPLRR